MTVAIVVYTLDSILQCRYLSFNFGGENWLFWAGWVLIESPLIFLFRLVLGEKKRVSNCGRKRVLDGSSPPNNITPN
jgi:hypothetical protein